MESYNIATIIFLSLLLLRVFVTCFCSNYRANGGCMKKNSSYADTSERVGSRHRHSDIFIIDLNDDSSNNSHRNEVQPPSYECLNEEMSPPDYEVAVKLPPLASNR
jgi:hypothetical protein